MRSRNSEFDNTTLLKNEDYNRLTIKELGNQFKVSKKDHLSAFETT